MSPRRAAKVDANQHAIVKHLRDIGATVQHIHDVGKGCPDILVGYQGINYLIELKDGDKAPSARRLTEDEERWHAVWRGQVAVANDSEEALRIVGAID